MSDIFNVELLFEKDLTFTYKLSFINKKEADHIKERLSQFDYITQIKYSRL